MTIDPNTRVTSESGTSEVSLTGMTSASGLSLLLLAACGKPGVAAGTGEPAAGCAGCAAASACTVSRAAAGGTGSVVRKIGGGAAPGPAGAATGVSAGRDMTSGGCAEGCWGCGRDAMLALPATAAADAAAAGTGSAG